MEQIEASIKRYLGQLDRTDRAEPEVAEARTERVQEKIATLRKEMERLRELESRMLAAPDKEISLTDPDARSMKTRGDGIVGYSVQNAVDTENHVIVAHEVINTGSDRHQLATMA